MNTQTPCTKCGRPPRPPSDQENITRFLRETTQPDPIDNPTLFCDELYPVYTRWVRARRAGPLLPRRTFITLVRGTACTDRVRYGVQYRPGRVAGTPPEIRRGFRGLALRTVWLTHTEDTDL